jgi:Tol biopolymer transport system component
MLFDDPQRSALAPVWSPRGDRIAFGLGRFFPMTQGLAPADVAVLNVDNRELTVLTDGSTNAGFPSWSPDGERLVYREWRKDGSRLLIIDARTKSVTPLLANFGNVNFPSWSPDGRLVQFTSDRDGNYELYTIELESQRIARLTHSPGNDAHAAWSPDGRWIVFSSVRQGFKDEGALYPGNPQGAGDLYVMRADGSDVRILTDNPFEDATPTWAPLRRR